MTEHPQCKCGGPRGFAHVNLVLHPHHEQSCHKGSAIRTLRHHAITKALEQLIGATTTAIPQTEVHHRENEETGFYYQEMVFETQRRKTNHHSEEEPSLIIADIAFSTDATNNTLIDVGIVVPAAATQLENESFRIAGAAAAAEESRKTAKYRTAFPLLNKNGGPKFYPFIIEAGGRPGPSVRLFLDSMIPVTDEGEKTSLFAGAYFSQW
jgi:hypothetical protein